MKPAIELGTMISSFQTSVDKITTVIGCRKEKKFLKLPYTQNKYYGAIINIIKYKQ